MKKSAVIALAACLVLCTACGGQGVAQSVAEVEQPTIASTVSEQPQTSVEPTPAPTPTPGPSMEPTFDLEAYEQQVQEFAVEAETNFIAIANVCVYEKNFWESFQNIGGTNSVPNDISEKGYAWLEENSDHTKDEIDRNTEAIETLYKDLILVEFDGKEAEELDGAVRDMYQGYKKLYDLSNSSASKNGMSTFINTYNAAFELFSSAKDTMTLFIDFPETEATVDQ